MISDHGKIIFRACLFLAWWMGVMLPTASLGQETSGGLSGKLTDAQAQPLAGATVMAVHLPSGTRYGTMTDADGRYSLVGMKIGGPYALKASEIGLQSITKQNIQIALGEAQTLDFVLAKDAQKLSEVVVRSARAGTKANNYGTATNISSDQIRNMPTVARSLQDLTRITPQGSRDNSFTGTSFRYNNITVDGAINNDAIGFSPSLGGQTGTSGQPGSSTRSNPFSLDAIQDVQVYLAPYDVKIGNFTGGSVNAVTRSGTNEVTGSIYAYGRNAALTGPDNAGDHSRLPASFHDVQTGFRVGFPLVKNKLFFFTNEEVDKRQDPILLNAGSAEENAVITLQDAQRITSYVQQKYGLEVGSYQTVNVPANSFKFFNRIDWNINDNNQLSIRDNINNSEAVNLERDQQDFRFGSIGYKQVNHYNSLVAELKTRLNAAMNNNLVVGYTSVHDYRDPSSNPAFPQIQIVGETPGTTIFFGTDREAAIFNQKQKTFEFTDNFSWRIKNHTITVGTHNEIYKIDYGFVNSWNGRVDYLSIPDFLQNNIYRVRGSYDYIDNNRNDQFNHPNSTFSIGFYSAYVQDEIHITDRFQIIPGLRFDYSDVFKHQPVNPDIQSSRTDNYYGTSYYYPQLNTITNSFLGRIQASPRLGFRFDAFRDQSLVLRGGLGLFTGRIPLAWLGYIYYNTGLTYGAYDQRQNPGQQAFVPNTDPLKITSNGIASFIQQNNIFPGYVNNPHAGQTQVDLAANDFTMPKVLRGSVALDFKRLRLDNWLKGLYGTVEIIYTKTVKDVLFQQVNVTDNPTYYVYDEQTLRQPVYPSSIQNLPNPHFSNTYILSNTDQGFRYNATAQLGYKTTFGLDVSAAYTYGQAKDISNGIRNSLESNWQLNQALSPNNPGSANSNFDIRNRVIGSVVYRRSWSERTSSSLSLFLSAQSGSPFTYGFVNASVQGLGQQVSLAYIPLREDAYRFFETVVSPSGQTLSPFDQATAFNQYIDGNHYLSSRRGNYTERNAGRTPWNTQADMKFIQEITFGNASTRHSLAVSVDCLNITNLINPNWGHVYFSPNTFNSTASVGLQVQSPFKEGGGYPIYTFNNPGKPYSVDFFNSRYQFQLGLRYSF